MTCPRAQIWRTIMQISLHLYDYNARKSESLIALVAVAQNMQVREVAKFTYATKSINC